MNVFISWSGDISKSIGKILHKYLPTILHDVKVFLSDHDIEAGSKWAKVLSDQLENTNFGILCLTPSNLNSRWLIYEAGALSKFSDSSVCGLLINGLKQTDVETPLSQFQNKNFSKSDIKSLLIAINNKRSNPLENERLTLLLDTLWPKIEEEYNDVLNEIEPNKNARRTRSDRELLEEILFKVRSLENKEFSIKNFKLFNMEELLDMPVNKKSVREYCKRKFPDMEISEQWERRFLSDLNTLRHSRIRDIDLAVSRTMPAMKEYAKEAPGAFSHSTDYLTKAFGFLDEEFRQVHSWSPKTLDAFEKYSNRLLKI